MIRGCSGPIRTHHVRHDVPQLEPHRSRPRLGGGQPDPFSGRLSLGERTPAPPLLRHPSLPVPVGAATLRATMSRRWSMWVKGRARSPRRSGAWRISGTLIGTPEAALAWVRQSLTQAASCPPANPLSVGPLIDVVADPGSPRQGIDDRVSIRRPRVQPVVPREQSPVRKTGPGRQSTVTTVLTVTPGGATDPRHAAWYALPWRVGDPSGPFARGV